MRLNETAHCDRKAAKLLLRAYGLTADGFRGLGFRVYTG